MATNDNTSNVVLFTGLYWADEPADTILQKQLGAYDKLLIIGWDKEGEFRFSGSLSDKRDILFLLKKAEKFIMEGE